MNSDTASQLQSLLGNSQATSGSGVSLLDTDALMKALLPITIIGTVLSIIIVLLYLFNVIQHYRVNRAIMESRDILREMNAREKAKEAPVIIATPPTEATETTTP
jgi:hypothetical protein